MPDRDRVTAFSGVAGKVVWGAFSPVNFATGLVLAVVALLVGFLCGAAQAPALSLVASQVLVALVVARYALNGRAGEWEGTFFSGAGGDAGAVLAVAGRYLLLTAVWLLPLFALGLSALEFGPEAAALFLGAGGKKLAVSLALYLAGLTLTPPLFAVKAVACETLPDLWSAGHWKKTFGGRLGDLFVLYAILLGAGVMALVVLLGPVLLLGSAGPRALVFWSGLAACFLGGFGTDCLGRLAGFYAAGEALEREPAGATAAPRPTAPARAPGVPPVAGPARPRPRPVQPQAGGSKPILLDRAGIDRAWLRFRTDPAGAIAELEHLREQHAPSPHILEALVLARARTGEAGAALELAREAMPLAFQRGNLHLAASMYRALGRRAGELGLSRDQLLIIGASLREMRDLRTAANTYAVVLGVDAAEPRAVKGSLEVAEAMLAQPDGVQGAHRLYRFLLERSPGSPWAEHMKRGLAEAERRLASA